MLDQDLPDIIEETPTFLRGGVSPGGRVDPLANELLSDAGNKREVFVRERLDINWG
jgi:hypothetical protein